MLFRSGAYFIGVVFVLVTTHAGVGVLDVVALALLLATVRGTWQAAKWQSVEGEPPTLRLNETLKDKFSDRMPEVVWPKARILFYVLAGIELLLLLLGLIGLLAQRTTGR